ASMFSVLCSPSVYLDFSFFFFFKDPPPPEIYTLSLHDALPISGRLLPGGPREVDALAAAAAGPCRLRRHAAAALEPERRSAHGQDRKSTRLNSSHLVISYAVFCLKKKKVCQPSSDYNLTQRNNL